MQQPSDGRETDEPAGTVARSLALYQGEFTMLGGRLRHR